MEILKPAALKPKPKTLELFQGLSFLAFLLCADESARPSTPSGAMTMTPIQLGVEKRKAKFASAKRAKIRGDSRRTLTGSLKS